MRNPVETLKPYTPIWRKSPLADKLDDFELEDWALADGWRADPAMRRGWLYHPVVRFGLALVGAAAIVAFAVALIAALYIVKSALGINLFAEHSMFHDWLYRP